MTYIVAGIAMWVASGLLALAAALITLTHVVIVKVSDIRGWLLLRRMKREQLAVFRRTVMAGRDAGITIVTGPLDDEDRALMRDEMSDD